eukprot:153104-Prorocentrum_minimum.AAC.2
MHRDTRELRMRSWCSADIAYRVVWPLYAGRIVAPPVFGTPRLLNAVRTPNPRPQPARSSSAPKEHPSPRVA